MDFVRGKRVERVGEFREFQKVALIQNLIMRGGRRCDRPNPLHGAPLSDGMPSIQFYLQKRRPAHRLSMVPAHGARRSSRLTPAWKRTMVGMKHKTIGILIDWTSTQYHQDLMFGISDKAEKLGLNLVCYEGGGINAETSFDRARNRIYDLVSDKVVDGLIIGSAQICRLLSGGEIGDFMEKFDSFPKISLGVDLPNVPSVMIDNRSGFRSLIKHLIDTHGCKNFAFIKGPEQSKDAVERFGAFLETLYDHKISFDRNLALAGDFTINSGILIARELARILERGSPPIDAVVSCNDEMGLEVMQYLIANGIRIPETVALTGFDDINRSKHAYPSLTTVKQPVYEMGKKAVELLMDVMDGRAAPPVSRLKTGLVIRESCGCSAPAARAARTGQRPAAALQGTKRAQAWARAMREFLQSIHASDLGLEAEQLIDGLTSSCAQALADRNGKPFMARFRSFVDALVPEGYYYETLERILGQFFHLALETADDTDEIRLLHELDMHTRSAVEGKLKQIAGETLIRLSEFKEMVLFFSRKLMMRFNKREFYLNLASMLPQFEIKNCSVAFFDPQKPGRSLIDFVFKNGALIPIQAGWKSFESERLVPDWLLEKDRKFNMIVEALIHEDACRGFIVFEKEGFSWGYYDQIYVILNNALQGTIMFQELQKQNETLLIQRENLDRNLKNLRQVMAGFVQTMSLTIEMRDQYTAGHQKRVSDLARSIATEMGLKKDQIEGLRMAATIHDLGKLFIPAEILNKPGQLTKIEFDLIKSHPAYAYDILKNVDFPWPIAEIIFQHHERLDGSGYPRGLAGGNILPEARIICVADVVDAMASHRPYRPSLGIDQALGEILKNKGKLYEPEAVDACVRLFREKNYRFPD